MVFQIGSKFIPGMTGIGRSSEDFVGRLSGFSSTANGEGHADIVCLHEGDGFGLVRFDARPPILVDIPADADTPLTIVVSRLPIVEPDHVGASLTRTAGINVVELHAANKPATLTLEHRLDVTFMWIYPRRIEAFADILELPPLTLLPVTSGLIDKTIVQWADLWERQAHKRTGKALDDAGRQIKTFLLHHIFEHYLDRGDEAFSDPAQFDAILAFVDSCSDKIPSIKDIGDRFGLTADDLATGFRRKTGLTPARYLLRRRVSQAATALTGSEASIADIAFSHGFANQAHFTTAFKEYVGVTPSLFRRLSLQYSAP